MSPSLIETLRSARELVSLSGRRGASWTYVAESLSLDPRYQRHILKYLSSRGYQVSEREGEDGDSVTIFAPSSEVWHFLGIPSPLDVPPDPGMQLLEIIGASRAQGIVVGEAIVLLHTKHLHPVIDKLYNANLIVKRFIFPIRQGVARVATRTTIMHLPRYSDLYDPSVDGVNISVDDNQNEMLQNDIIQFMESLQLREILLQNLVAHLGFDNVKHLRRRVEAVIAQLKGDSKLQLVSKRKPESFSTVPSIYLQIVSDADDAADDNDASSTTPGHPILGMPLLEQIVYRLNACNAAFPSNQLREIMGLGVKRASAVTNTLMKEYGHHSVTIQMKKQKVQCLQSFHTYPHALDNAAALMELLDRVDGRVGANPCETDYSTRGTHRQASTEGADGEVVSAEPAGAVGSLVVDLFALRREVVLECIEEFGGVLDAYTGQKVVQDHYSRHGVQLEVDKKTIHRLFKSLKKEMAMDICDCSALCDGAAVKLSVVLYKPDIPDIDAKIDAYVDNFMHWLKCGRAGLFNNTPVVEDAVGIVSAEEVENSGRAILIDSIEIPPLFSDVIPLSPLAERYPQGWVCDKVTNPDEVDKTVARCKPSACLSYLLKISERIKVQSLPSVHEDNCQFVEALCDLYVILARQGNRLSVGEVLTAPDGKKIRAEMYSFTAIDALLKMSFRALVKKVGLPEKYVEWNAVRQEDTDGRVIGKEIAAAATSGRVSIEQMLRHEDPALVRVVLNMVARAFEFVKIELICLVSLGILYVMEQDDDAACETLSVVRDAGAFDRQMCREIMFKMRVKCNRRISKEQDLRRYWATEVKGHIHNSLSSLDAAEVSLREVARESYLQKPPSCYHIPILPPLKICGVELPAEDAPSLVGDSRDPKKKRNRRAANFLDNEGGDFLKRSRRGDENDETGTVAEDVWDTTDVIHSVSSPGDEDEADENGPTARKDSMPKTVRGKNRYDFISGDKDEDAHILSAVLHRVLAGSVSRPLPDILNDAVPGLLSGAEARCADDETAVFPWHHPYRQILPWTTESTDLVGAMGEVGISWGTREKGRRANALTEQYSTIRKATARVISSIGATGFGDICSSIAVPRDSDAISAESKSKLADTVNDILDTERCNRFTEIFCSRLDEAAVTRALQVYASCPSALSVFDVDESDGTDDLPALTDEELEAEKKNMREGLQSLQQFPFAVTSRVHRELYGKNYLVRRKSGNKRNIFGENIGFEFHERFLGSLSKGMTKLFWTLQTHVSRDGDSSPLATASVRALNIETESLSSLELLGLLHAFAKMGGLDQASVLVEEEEATAESLAVRVGVNDLGAEPCCAQNTPFCSQAVCPPPHTSSPHDSTVKKIGHTSTGRQADVLNRISVHLNTAIATTPRRYDVQNIREDAPAIFAICQQSSEWMRSVVRQKCSNLDGSTLESLLEAILSHPNNSMAADTVAMSSMVEALLAVMCNENTICRVPHYNARYESAQFYVTKELEAFYFVQEASAASVSLSTHPDERVCPWIRYDGLRNRKLYTVFVSRVTMILCRKPMCTAATIHLELPMLTNTHMAILLKCMVSEEIIFRKEMPSDSTACCNIFGDISKETPCILFSLSPSLWR